MHKPISLIFATFSMAGLCFAQSQQLPANRILPDDVVQESIRLIQLETNSFAVRWTYTEAGARKMVAFEEAHMGQNVQTVIGTFESHPHLDEFRPTAPLFTSYDQWKKGWLKRRTDNMVGLSEADSMKILAGLRAK
jgi:hypothetical protein